MMKKWKHSLRLLPLLLAVSFLLSGCGKQGVSALEPQGPVGHDQAWLMLFSLAIMVIVVLVVGFLFTYALVRFRKRPGQEDVIPEQTEGNMKLEILWTVIPVILLAILAVPTVAKTFSLSDTSTPKGQKVVTVNVTAHQYWWEFEYPDLGITTAQDLYIPTGTKVVFNLTSKDVVHSFWVPGLGGKQDANPGINNHLWLKADTEGTYKGRCAELCGQSHALMYFNVKAVSPQAFKQWTADMKKGAAAPVSAEAEQGQQIFQQTCTRCHATDVKNKSFGPNLANFGDRDNIGGVGQHTKQVLMSWITNPDNVKPGTNMPAFGQGQGGKTTLTNDQIKAVATYLMGLKVQHQ